MIHESRYWKKPLLNDAAWLESLRLNAGNWESRLALVEKKLFISFYVIRKLLDTLKVSDKTKAKSYKLAWSHRTNVVDYMNWHRIDDNFDLKTRHVEARNIRFVCDQIIHSFVFVPAIARRGKLAGFYLSSDRMRHEKLYFINLRQVTSAFRLVGNDYPTDVRWKRNSNNDQIEAIVK